jgi:VIT1/CCC1 family predicted Fe2+/Mn2+ transporter
MRLVDYIGRYWASAEVMYAVIIAMTFTSTLRGPISHFETSYYNVVYSALFCCIAWGIADGYFYAWERNYNIRVENRIIEFSKVVDKNEAAIPLIGEQLDDTILRNIDEKARHEMYNQLVKYLAKVGMVRKPSPRDAFNIIFGAFMTSSVAALIVVLPFFLIDHPIYALGISNLLGISLLFMCGYFRAQDRNLLTKVLTGFAAATIGIIIALVTVLLGG